MGFRISSRKFCYTQNLRNKIMKQLPFQLQTSLSDKVKLIESFDVLSIAEWNEKYTQYPINKVETTEE